MTQQKPLNQNNEKIIIVGRFGAPFGVKGWVKLQSFTKPAENIIDYRPWQMQIKGSWQPVNLIEVRQHHKNLIALIQGCTSPEQAVIYRNVDIGIYRHQLPEAGPDEIYWSDLEGLTVHSVEGTVLGTVNSIFATGANDVLVVRTPEHKELLIPYVREQVIKSVDLAKGVIVVDWVGL